MFHKLNYYNNDTGMPAMSQMKYIRGQVQRYTNTVKTHLHLKL